MSASDNPERPVQAQRDLFPIRTVSTITGVNSVTLRAWERRYALVTPHRTPKGHRLYSRDDIELINRVVQYLESGIPISQVSRLLRDGASDAAAGGAGRDVWSEYQTHMIDAITRFDESALNGVYNEALSVYPVDIVTQRLVVPLLRALGERWESATGSVAEEHFFGVYLRNKLGARFHHLMTRSDGPRLLTACLPGEHHEVGLQLFCLSATALGYRFVQLGSDMPLEDIPSAARRSRAAAVVLSGSVEPPPALLEQQLPRMVARLEVPVFIGGATAVRHHDAIQRSGAVPLGVDFATALRLLDARLREAG